MPLKTKFLLCTNKLKSSSRENHLGVATSTTFRLPIINGSNPDLNLLTAIWHLQEKKEPIHDHKAAGAVHGNMAYAVQAKQHQSAESAAADNNRCKPIICHLLLLYPWFLKEDRLCNHWWWQRVIYTRLKGIS